MPRNSHRHRNAEVNFRGEKRSDATHVSKTDLDARLCKKSPGTGAVLSFIGHALMGHRNGLIVQGGLTQLTAMPSARPRWTWSIAIPRIDPSC